ncbi:hypothetical protein BaRGS_00003531 [Batillaria attramentaria]|uniref:Uncharacterized protein n=1 Tax=Batillaria attramentaria TaxID=370345 RepID=A0ABD0M0A4_9CAEN
MGKKHKKHKVDKKDASGSEAMDPEASSDQTQTQDKGEKPLKLVLKGGDGLTLKRNHPDESGDMTGASSEEPAVKKLCTETGGTSGNVSGADSSDERIHRSPRSCTIRNDDGAILRQCLQYLQKILQNKDVNGSLPFR